MTAFLTRRGILKLGGLAAASAALPPLPALAAERRHGMSLFGDLKYAPDFQHFDYADPQAPAGGRIVMQAPSWNYNQNPSTFNTLNSFVLKGDAPPRMELTFDTLMAAAADEPDAMYGLVAEAVEIADDGNEVRFFLRATPRFHDGSPLTAEDVAFSIGILKTKGHPLLAEPLAQVAAVEAIGPREVAVRFTGRQSRELKLLVAALPIFSRTYSALNDIEASTLTPPLGSGRYKVGAMSAGRYIEYQRAADYWGGELPVNRGVGNFDVIRIEFYRERTAGFEAFKKGAITVREEFTSKTWATEYTFPALAAGQVVKTVVPGEPVADFQGFYFNTRRPQFADAMTRQAIATAFDFEWINANLFFGLYERSSSYFEGSEMAAHGPPSAAELADMAPFRGQLPAAVFAEPYVPPKSDGSGHDRKLLGEAARLLKEAGWERQGAGLRRQGIDLTAEFLIPDPVFSRALGPFVEALRSIGVIATIRLMDPSQYELRQTNFDFDLVAQRLTLGTTPLETLRNLFGSASAGVPGSHNLAGIRSPAIDALIDKALQAPDRATHRTILSAVDRILRAGHYSIPEWHKGERWVAKWDMFGQPAVKPAYGFPLETTWWFDREKAARIGKAG